MKRFQFTLRAAIFTSIAAGIFLWLVFYYYPKAPGSTADFYIFHALLLAYLILAPVLGVRGMRYFKQCKKISTPQTYLILVGAAAGMIVLSFLKELSVLSWFNGLDYGFPAPFLRFQSAIPSLFSSYINPFYLLIVDLPYFLATLIGVAALSEKHSRTSPGSL